MVDDREEVGEEGAGFDPTRMAVGDRLWFVPARRYQHAQWVEVSKVGRKWASLSGVDGGYFSGRVERGRRALDAGGHSSPGKLYASREEHETERDLDRIWSGLRLLVQGLYRRPEHLGAEDLQRLIATIRDSRAEDPTQC